MANTKSAKKAARQIARRTVINKSRRTRMRSAVRKVEEAITAGDRTAAAAAMAEAEPALVRAARKGIVYFTAPREPFVWAGVLLTLVMAVAAFAARARPVAFPLLLGFAAAAAGFATATIKTRAIDHPILRHPAFGVDIAGFVEFREERERSDRMTVRVHRIEARRLDQAPERVRLSVRKKTMPPVGAYVTLKARLSPPQLLQTELDLPEAPAPSQHAAE